MIHSEYYYKSTYKNINNNDDNKNITTYKNKYISEHIKYNNDLLNTKYFDTYYSLSDNYLQIYANVLNQKIAKKLIQNNILIDKHYIGDVGIDWLLSFYLLNISKKNNVAVISPTALAARIMKIFDYTIDLWLYNNIRLNIPHDFLSVIQLQKIIKQEIRISNIKAYEYEDNLQNKKYDYIIDDTYISLYYQINAEFELMIQGIKQRELINCLSLDNMYKHLDNLNNGGSLIIYYPFISNKCSLIMLETIMGCFKKITAHSSHRLFGLLYGVRFVFSGYVKKFPKIKHNSENFIKYMNKLNKLNNNNNKSIILARKSIDILLKCNPTCFELEAKYQMNRHKCFMIMKSLNIKTIVEPIENNILDLFKRMITKSLNVSIRINIRCTSLYAHLNETHQMCNNPYSGLLYDIFINELTTLNTKEMNKILCYNKQYFIKKKLLSESKNHHIITRYIKKHQVTNPIHLFLTNVEFKIVDLKTIVYLYDDSTFEKNILLWLNDSKITHIQSDFKTNILTSKCVIACHGDTLSTKFHKQILYTMHILNNGDQLIIRLTLPIETKIVLDLLYIIYCSFKTIYIDYPQPFSNDVYILCVGYKTSLSTAKVLALDYQIDLTERSIIPDQYMIEFRDDFMSKLNNFLSMITIQNELRLHFVSYWNSVASFDVFN